MPACRPRRSITAGPGPAARLAASPRRAEPASTATERAPNAGSGAVRAGEIPVIAIHGRVVRQGGARTHRDIGAFASDLRDRISALGRTHSLPDPSDGQGVSDRAGLIGATLRPVRGIMLHGPEAALTQG